MENQNNVALQEPQRDIDTVTTEIRSLVHQAQTMALVYAIEIGRRLHEAKGLLPHGEWGSWLKEKVDFSQSTANNMMRIFDEYGDCQITLFGATANSQTLGNLPYTKALKLLAVPADEREEFVEKNDVEHLSSRELEKLIKERDSAVRERAAADERAALMTEELEELRASLGNREAAVKAASDREQALRDQLLEAQEKAAAAKEELEKAKGNTEVPESVLKKLKAEAKKEAAEAQKKAADKMAAEAEEKLHAAESQRKAAEADALAAKAKVEQLEKKLTASSPAVAVFQTHFEQLQITLAKCTANIQEIGESDPALAEKLTAAMRAACGKYLG